jgi:hypothetical protein
MQINREAIQVVIDRTILPRAFSLPGMNAAGLLVLELPRSAWTFS